jgi:hypothetical protein
VTALKTDGGQVLHVGSSVAQRLSDEPSGTPAGLDALGNIALTKIEGFTTWLSSQGVDGYLGETGWPYAQDNAEWQIIGNAVYDWADRSNLPVTYWATGEKWSQTYILLGYNGIPVGTALAPSAVIEAHPGAMRGINVAGGEFPQAGFAANDIGVYGTGVGQDYSYSTQATYTYLAGRGVKMVRLPLRWERLQPTLNAALDSTELGRLTTAVGYAANAGLTVILDPHQAAGYLFAGPTLAKLGSGSLPLSAFTDFWTRMATAFVGNPTIAAYGLMNEPGGMPSAGEIYSNSTTLYGFDSNITGWTVGAANEVWSASQSGSMEATPAISNVSVETNNTLRDRSAGGLSFWADVFIPSNAVGTWSTALQSQDSSFNFLRNGFVTLNKGQVTRLRMDLTLSQAQAMRNLQISWGGSGRNGTDQAFVLGVFQGTYVSSGTPAQLWEQASQQAVAGIRTVDASTPISVAGYLVEGEAPFGVTHPVAWIDDPNILYEFHLYYDADGSGNYLNSYATDLAAVS